MNRLSSGGNGGKPAPSIRDADSTTHCQVDKVQNAVSTVAEESLNTSKVFPSNSLSSVEAEEEFDGNGTQDCEETILSNSPANVKPPTPPRRNFVVIRVISPQEKYR